MRARRRRGAENAPFPFLTRTALLNIIAGAVVGLALGLFYTWYVDPVDYVDTAPASLRADHKDDYALMIAQAYALDHDLDLARTRLAPLNLSNPGQYLADLAAAEIQRGAPLADLRALSDLTLALGGIPPPLP
jgi:hypothetical protein